MRALRGKWELMYWRGREEGREAALFHPKPEAFIKKERTVLRRSKETMCEVRKMGWRGRKGGGRKGSKEVRIVRWVREGRRGEKR